MMAHQRREIGALIGWAMSVADQTLTGDRVYKRGKV
jgi:hypothetical protein